MAPSIEPPDNRQQKNKTLANERPKRKLSNEEAQDAQQTPKPQRARVYRQEKQTNPPTQPTAPYTYTETTNQEEMDTTQESDNEHLNEPILQNDSQDSQLSMTTNVSQDKENHTSLPAAQAIVTQTDSQTRPPNLVIVEDQYQDTRPSTIQKTIQNKNPRHKGTNAGRKQTKNTNKRKVPFL